MLLFSLKLLICYCQTFYCFDVVVTAAAVAVVVVSPDDC
jgi:hypothetical protein